MLPPSNEYGELPPGVHVADWPEVERRFGSSTVARVRALAKLQHLHELAVRTGRLRNFYIFGSFVSDAPGPRDVDVVLIMDGKFKVEECPRESRTLFSHADAEARYGASIFWLRDGTLSLSAMQDFLHVWQTRRDGSLRGILEVV